jgi:hypothetical protein
LVKRRFARFSRRRRVLDSGAGRQQIESKRWPLLLALPAQCQTIPF